MTEVSAKLSRFKSSASKIRLLADQIRGKKLMKHWIFLLLVQSLVLEI